MMTPSRRAPTALRLPDRVSWADIMQSATSDGRAAGHIGSILIFEGAPGFGAEQLRRTLCERISAVPRLRQRLRRAPPGCGRPYWADDPAFDIANHFRCVRCPPPGDDGALLGFAAAELSEPLPRSRPLWSATLLTGLADGGAALLLIVDHVLADGTALLSVLGVLADLDADAVRARAAAFPAAGPSTRDLVVDAWRARLGRLLATAPVPLGRAGGLRRLREGAGELGGTRRRPATSLNRPVGPRRRIDVVTADLAAIRDFGHRHGGTVNDVLLAAVAGTLRALLADRGEQLEDVAITVPVAARQAADGELGNQIGIMTVTVPAVGDLGTRTARTAAITRQRKAHGRGASAAVFVPAFVLLARIGLLHWFINRQRAVQTFVTNLRGPGEPLAIGGAAVRAVIPVPSTTGNVTVTFAATSYAGTLCVTILSDPDRVPDVSVLAAALRRELDAPRSRKSRQFARRANPGFPGCEEGAAGLRR